MVLPSGGAIVRHNMLLVADVGFASEDCGGLGAWAGRVGRINWLLDLGGSWSVFSWTAGDGLGLEGVCSIGIWSWGNGGLEGGLLDATELVELSLLPPPWRGCVFCEVAGFLLKLTLSLLVAEARGVLSCGISSMYLEAVTEVVFGWIVVFSFTPALLGSTWSGCCLILWAVRPAEGGSVPVSTLEVAILGLCGSWGRVMNLLFWVWWDVCCELAGFRLLTATGCGCTLMVLLVPCWYDGGWFLAVGAVMVADFREGSVCVALDVAWVWSMPKLKSVSCSCGGGGAVSSRPETLCECKSAVAYIIMWCQNG